MFDRRPGLVARCSVTVDVVKAVRFARQHGLIGSVRGGDHTFRNVGFAALEVNFRPSPEGRNAKLKDRYRAPDCLAPRRAARLRQL
jgi:hypothetical protein